MFNVGSQELLIILFVVLLLFGAKRIPEVARSFGQGMRDFKKAMQGIEDELRVELDEKPKRPPSRPALQAPVEKPGTTAAPPPTSGASDGDPSSPEKPA